MLRRRLLSLAAGAVAVLLASPARAQDWSKTIEFDEYAPGRGYRLTMPDVTISSGDYFSHSDFDFNYMLACGCASGIDQHALHWASGPTNGSALQLMFEFTSPITYFSLLLSHRSSQHWEFTAAPYDVNGEPIPGGISGNADAHTNFPMETVEWRFNAPQGVMRYAFFTFHGDELIADHLQFGVVANDPRGVEAIVTPEPASLALLGTGLLAFGAAGWRRKRRERARE